MIKLGLCVVGCGSFARTFAQAISPMEDEVDLYFASRELQRAEAYTHDFHGRAAFGSYAAAAADPRVTAMYLCTPHHLHLEHVLMAARAGKHILVEKPIARNLRESREMVSQARGAGVKFMVAENYRYMSVVQGARELVTGGAIGELRMIQLQEEAHFKPGHWREDEELNGGGVLIDGGIHKADMLIYLSGMPDQVYAARLPRGLPGDGAEDGAVVMTQTPDGVVGIINHSWTASQNPPPPRVSISGTEGTIYFEVGSPWLRINDGRGESTLLYDDDQQGLVAMVREFSSCIEERREPLTSGAAGIGALTIIVKAYESMKSGEAVPLG